MKPSFRRLSAAGASALSLWELSAPAAAMADLLGANWPQRVNQMVLARSCFAFDEALCWCRAAPDSTDSHYLIEVHLHGGFGVAAAFRALLASNSWFEVKDEKGGELDDYDFLNATSPLAVRIFAARRQQAWPKRMAYISSLEGAELQQQVASLQQWNEWGSVLAQPPNLLLAGPPNAGKSTLLNTWVQERRVTASAAVGTTRDLVAVPCFLGIGAESFVVQLVDSAGVWEQAQGVDKAAVEMSLQAICEAWRVIWVFDAATPPSSSVLRAVNERSNQDLLVVNRCDLAAGWQPEQVLPRSFLRGQEQDLSDLVGEFEKRILRQLGPPPPVGQLVAVCASEREELQALAARDSRRHV